LTVSSPIFTYFERWFRVKILPRIPATLNQTSLYRPGTKGFSLVETLISMFLLMSLAIYVFTMFATTSLAMQFSENRANAALIANGLMDTWRAKGFTYLDTTYPAINSSTDTTIATGSYAFPASYKNGAAFSQTFNYTVKAKFLDTACKKLCYWVTLTWYEAGLGKQMTVESVITP